MRCRTVHNIAERAVGRKRHMRREFVLPEGDAELLDDSGLQWEAITEGASKWLIIRSIPVPSAFVASTTSVAIQIPTGYPAAGLDMAFFSPPVRRVDGGSIPCTEATQNIDGLLWQRWSRHYTSANPWKIGEYNILTHYLLCLSWLDRDARRGMAA
jgi:hypothetical protein